jgi:hypothetical protein
MLITTISDQAFIRARAQQPSVEISPGSFRGLSIVNPRMIGREITLEYSANDLSEVIYRFHVMSFRRLLLPLPNPVLSTR